MKPLVQQNRALLILRAVMPLFLVVHGITRLSQGSVNGFGEYLNEVGFPQGHIIAWLLTVIEIVGSFLMIFGYLVPIFALIFISELIAGILLVHAKNGWFVVGGGTNGVEYSVLLIVCYAVLAISYPVMPNKTAAK